MPWAMTFTLTYADIDGVPPLGARVYRYKDVQDFWKRIRRAAERKWQETIEFRYIVVGEKGTKNGRCHYHGVMFASRPMTELGKHSWKQTAEQLLIVDECGRLRERWRHVQCFEFSVTRI